MTATRIIISNEILSIEKDGKVVIQIFATGTVELAECLDPDLASMVFWQGVRTFGHHIFQTWQKEIDDLKKGRTADKLTITNQAEEILTLKAQILEASYGNV